ncbi:MAG: GGDEF domain-containing protein [Rhodoferax sp.]
MPATARADAVSLQDLLLENARALLARSTELPLPETSPTQYLQAVIDGLCELSLRDPLTGLSNRRCFLGVLERTIESVARSGESALLLMLDIDHFKQVNDQYGHLVGDQVLRSVGEALSTCVRPMDTVARYGGEEFAVVVPNCPSAYGDMVAERLRASIEALRIPIGPGQTLQVTISVGGAFAPEWVRSTAALWTERADAQLYRAKTEGRNRVCLDLQREIYVSAEEKSLLFGHLSFTEPPADAPAGTPELPAAADASMHRVI